MNKNLNFPLHKGILNKILGPFRPVRPAGLDFQARHGTALAGPRAARPVTISRSHTRVGSKVYKTRISWMHAHIALLYTVQCAQAANFQARVLLLTSCTLLIRIGTNIQTVSNFIVFYSNHSNTTSNNSRTVRIIRIQ